MFKSKEFKQLDRLFIGSIIMGCIMFVNNGISVQAATHAHQCIDVIAWESLRQL